MMDLQEVDLVQYMSVKKWQPKIGDFIVWHGMIYSRWFGVVSNIDHKTYTVSIIKSGLPVSLFTMSKSDMIKKKNIKTIDIGKIHNSRGGEWAAMQQMGSSIVWFI